MGVVNRLAIPRFRFGIQGFWVWRLRLRISFVGIRDSGLGYLILDLLMVLKSSSIGWGLRFMWFKVYGLGGLGFRV